MDFSRGLRKALLYALVGFVIPVAFLGLASMYHFMLRDINPRDRENDLARLPLVILTPSIGLASLFGLATLASFAPPDGPPFIRSLIIISAATLVGVVVIRPRPLRKMTDPHAWYAIVVPLGAALTATAILLLISGLKSHEKADGDDPGAR